MHVTQHNLQLSPLHHEQALSDMLIVHIRPHLHASTLSATVLEHLSFKVAGCETLLVKPPPILQYHLIIAKAHCAQAARPTEGQVTMGEGKAGFGGAGGMCKGRVARQMGQGSG